MKNNAARHVISLSRFGRSLAENSAEREDVIESAWHRNPWFTPQNSLAALEAAAGNLREEHLQEWLKNYPDLEEKERAPQRVGLVLAGNIPLVGLHDVLCVLVSGHHAVVKISSQDKQLTPWALGKLMEADPRYRDRITLTDRLERPDAVIATGSNNSSRYFDFYFGRYPHIIRKNRNAAAVLNGEENDTDLQELGTDIFRYFGLGCRNVSKLFVPRGYDFDRVLKALESCEAVIRHHKYAGNFNYQLTLLIMNKVPHYTNRSIVLREHPSYASPMATLYFEYYDSAAALEKRLQADSDRIQCIVSAGGRFPGSLPFGRTQHPALWDYADKVDTMDFLLKL